MTQEEKARCYDEAIKKAEPLYKAAEPMSGCNVLLETIFPELKESEDERIRKGLINYFNDFSLPTFRGLDPKKILAWLEKQGERKPVEKVNGEDYGIDSLWHAERILEKTLGEVKGYQSDDGILEHKAAITAVKKLYEQKPVEWSENDEKMLQDAILSCQQFENDDAADWLKSLHPQNRWKPSKEQLDAIKVAKAYITNVSLTHNAPKILEDLLKQLKEL